MEDSIHDVIESQLKEIISAHPSEYKTALEIMTKLLKNIIEHPEDPKFRVIKKSNAIISSKLLNIPEIVGLLEILGYEEGTDDKKDCYIYDGSFLETLKDCLNIINKLLSNPGYKVIVYQYDLTQGMAKAMSRGLIGKQVDGVWHTGVCVFGKEYYYGGGICVGKPKKTPYGYPVKELDFGYTTKTEADLKAYIKSINNQFTMNTYNILNHNCNHFTDAALYFLVGKHLPDSILKQHEELLNTPMGQMVRPLLERMNQGNNAFLPNMFEGRNNNGGF
jgi:hypothetical protein